MSGQIRAAFLLLSDLHFGNSPLEEGSVPVLQYPWFTQSKRTAAVTQFFERECKTHNLAILSFLPLYLRSCVAQLRAGGFPRTEFDLCLLAGDLASFADDSAYEFLFKYLTLPNFLHPPNSLPSVNMLGLNFNKPNIIALPGNHDKLLRSDLELFSTGFLQRLGAKLYPLPQNCFLVSREIAKHEYLFILADASIYTETPLELDSKCRRHLARGKVTDSLRVGLNDKLEKIRAGERIDSAFINDFKTATKILIVHYGAFDFLRPAASTPWKAAADTVLTKLLPHRCDGFDSLIQHLNTDIDLVIHGHLHAARMYKRNQIPTLAVGTLSQAGNSENGFHILKFYETGQVVAEHHIWNGVAFVRDPSPSRGGHLK